MSTGFISGRSCPHCGSQDYQFRSRKKVSEEQENPNGPLWETKFRCKACELVWVATEILTVRCEVSAHGAAGSLTA